MKRLPWAFLALAVAILACNFGRTPPPTVAVSDEAAQELQQGVATAMQEAADTGSMTLNVTESQLTSALALALQQKSSLPIEDVQIHLRDELVTVSGSATQQNISLPVQIEAKVSAIDCKPKVEIVSASAGPLPIPQEQISGFLPMIENTITALISSSSVSNLCLLSISVGDGTMTVTGQVPQ